MDAQFPAHLNERIRYVNDRGICADNEFVLCWLHHAIRAHENPALDVALHIGNQLSKPILVYQGLAGRHRYNSDRHHTFIMEGAADLQQDLHARGVAYAFFLPTDTTQPSPLSKLISRSVALITEDFPAPPFPVWLKRVAGDAATQVLAVDCDCVIPMQSIGKAYDRAFKFRSKTWAEFESRSLQKWTESDVEVPAWNGNLPFDPVDFSAASIPDLVAQCPIDHGIGPIHHTTGGSRAGYQRWDEFLRHGMSGYANLRNDAAVDPPKGVSRMSAYLHHGHVSPFKIARDATHRGGKGAEKFLDELLIWRELAHNFCYYRRDIEEMTCLPRFAQDTLTRHADDQRANVYTWEQLARGQTHDELWNTAQHSLLRHGELHNNLRMTWGKALLQWTQSPQEALATLIDLNHRFALDGNNPNSYGGLLWCLGLFDRPFEPPQPIVGTVRSRSTASHRVRIDFNKYEKRIAHPAGARRLRIGVVGAGISGLIAARTLVDNGHSVVVFDKGRGVGGRTCVRHYNDHRFDHGAQYFKSSGNHFARYVRSWQQAGLIDEWQARFGVAKETGIEPDAPTTPRYVGVDGSNVIAKHLATNLDVRTGIRVMNARYSNETWLLTTASGEDVGNLDALVVALPPTQAAEILPSELPVAAQLAKVPFAPCWTVMAVFESTVPCDYDALRVTCEHPLAWVARDGSKPKKTEPKAWVLQATAAWSAENFEQSPEHVQQTLLHHLESILGSKLPSVRHVDSQRWKYALAQPSDLPSGIYWQGDRRLAVCGDWCFDGKIEGAFESGIAAAGRILGLPNKPTATTLF